jgi:alkaline phosphatase D
MHRRCLVLFAVLLCPAFINAQDKPLTRIAFGSCAQQERDQPIWDTIVQTKPDLFLFAGDNIYGDTEDMDIMKAKYDKLAAKPGYQKLKAMCPILATWDDHDYGVNDGGKNYKMRKESQQLFLDAFDFAKDSPLRTQEGIYHAKMFGPEEQRVQVIMLDTRYFRDNLKKRPNAPKGVGPYIGDSSSDLTILGDAQWKWLEDELKKPAKLRLVVSSIQVVPEDHGWEKWMNIPAERDRLYKLIRDTKASGVVFLSGDRHHAELSMMDGGVGYPLYDLTSSGLNQAFLAWRSLEKNQHRVATMQFGNNFGLIEIDWDAKDPLVRLQIRDEQGDITIQQKVPLSVLTIGKLQHSERPQVKLASGEILTRELLEKNLNKEVTVTVKIQSTGMSKTKGFVFLNAAKSFMDDNNFTIVLTREAQEQMKTAGIAAPQKHYLGKSIRVEGTLGMYQDRPEIIVKEAGQIKILSQ